jgi:hypothetical protein
MFFTVSETIAPLAAASNSLFAAALGKERTGESRVHCFRLQ